MLRKLAVLVIVCCPPSGCEQANAQGDTRTGFHSPAAQTRVQYYTEYERYRHPGGLYRFRLNGRLWVIKLPPGWMEVPVTKARKVSVRESRREILDQRRVETKPFERTADVAAAVVPELPPLLFGFWG